MSAGAAVVALGATACFAALGTVGSLAAAASGAGEGSSLLARQEAGADRAVVLEAMLELPPPAVFRLWTTEDGLRKFMAPASRIDAEVGGRYEVIFDPELDPQGASLGTKGARILHLVPGKKLAFEWTMPPFASAFNTHPLPTWVEIDLAEANATGRTHLRLAHRGFGPGPEWDQPFVWFRDVAWPRVLRDLVAYCRQEERP